MDAPELQPPLPSFGRSGDEPTTLVEMLDYYRAVLARKGSGLTAAELSTKLAPSSLTIGGLLFHMALVEDNWFQERFEGNDAPEPWASMDWDADRDWEINNAHTLTPAELFAQYDESLARSRAVYDRASSLDQLAVRANSDGKAWNLRWIMVHMIEEYARHCGHADFIRESIDATTDD